MTQFQASLIASGDPEPLPTVVELDQGKLVIQSNGQPLGNWPVSDLEFVRIVGGFRVTLDGEVAVLKLVESDEFNAELRKLNEGAAEAASQKKPRKRKRERNTDVKSDQPVAVATAEPVSKKMKAPVLDRPAETPGPGARGQTFFNWMDAKLEVAAKRGGKYLPQWIFTRGGVAVGLLLLIAILVFPGPFSAVFLIGAAVGMITSAIALMDQVIANRIFRGGFTPIHGLIGSLALVLIGLLLASL